MRHALTDYEKEWKPSHSQKPTPKGWSNDWSTWPLLFTLFATGPYFINLSQIAMLVSVKYKIPGDTRPIMFDVKNPSKFVFEQRVEEPHKVTLYLGDCKDMTILKIDKSITEDILMRKLKGDSWKGIGLVKLKPDRDGQAVLEKILKGGRNNEDVVDLLGPDGKIFLTEKPDVKRLIEEEVKAGLLEEGLLEEGEDVSEWLARTRQDSDHDLMDEDEGHEDEEWNKDEWNEDAWNEDEWNEDEDYDDDADEDYDEDGKPREMDKTSNAIIEALLDGGMNGELSPEAKQYLGDWEDTEEGSKFGNPEFHVRKNGNVGRGRRGRNRRKRS